MNQRRSEPPSGGPAERVGGTYAEDDQSLASRRSLLRQDPDEPLPGAETPGEPRREAGPLDADGVKPER